jgi:hypothetical protein
MELINITGKERTKQEATDFVTACCGKRGVSYSNMNHLLTGKTIDPNTSAYEISECCTLI